jgi:hypothetical protein
VVSPLSTHLVAATRNVAVVLTLRLLPFALCLALRPRGAALVRRVLWGAGCAGAAAVAWWLGAWLSLVFVAIGLLYYLAVSLGVNAVSRRLAAGQVTRGGVLFLSFFFYLLLPGLVLPELAMSAFLFVGWDLALSSYSYAVETSRRGATRATLGDCLFFLLVNPTVLYTVRGKEVPGPVGAAGVARALVGLGLIFVNVAVLRPLAFSVRGAHAFASLPAGVALAAMAFAFARFFEIYAAHSGLASLQIGLMRQVGWSVPERYDYPVLAVSPIDFWRRWNTYVRMWLEAYVFLPLAMRMARKTRRPEGQAVAAAATLVASGVIHCAFVFAGRQSLEGMPFGLYVAAGILVAIWQLARLFRTKILRRLKLEGWGEIDLVNRLFGRLALAAAVVGAAVAWG